MNSSQSAAKLAGDKYYFTGRLCKRGHIDLRFTSSGTCKACRSVTNMEWAKANPDKVAPVRARFRMRHRKRLCAEGMEQYTKRIKRCPQWSEVAEIKEFYNNCPPGHEVDHEIPLQGKLISGLHVIGNLQYLPAVENRRKHNSWSPETTPL